MKNITIPMEVLIPVSDGLIFDLLESDYVNGCIFWGIEEEDGDYYTADMWQDYYKSYGSVTKPAEEIYGGIILHRLDESGVYAVLLNK